MHGRGSPRQRKSEMKKLVIGLFLAIAVSFWTVRPLLSPGYFPMHDDTQVSRVIVMSDALKNGQFPVRWVDGLGYGYGYPIFNFYGPLPYYFGAAVNMAAIDAVTATKIMFLAGLVLGGIFMYVSLVPFIGPPAAIVSAVLYLFAPYHAVQAYVRGAVGELWAYAFLPLCLYGVLVRDKRLRSRAILVGGLGIAGVVLSHTVFGYLTGMVSALVLAVSAVFSLLRRKMPESAIRLFLMTAMGFGLSAFFWLPAFLEKRFTRVEGFLWDPVRLSDHFVCPGQLWSSPWGYGGSALGCTDGMSFAVGKLHCILFAAGALTYFLFRNRFRDGIVMRIGLVLTAVSVFMVLPWSDTVWRLVPFGTYVQYPWRLLAVVSLGVAVTAGAAFAATVKDKPAGYLFAGIVAALVIGMNAKWFRPQFTFTANPATYREKTDLSWRVSKISDEYLPPQIIRPQSPSEIPSEVIKHPDTISVEYEKITETYIKARITADSAGRIMVNRAYFPGWQYLIDGRVRTPEVVHALPELEISPGLHVYEMRFTDTPIRYLGNVLSIITGIIVIILYGKKSYR